MEVFTRSKDKKITPHKLRLANKCRVYLRVITVAELADLDGQKIHPDKLNGNWRADSTLVWPNQPMPSQKMWDAFRLCLRKTICSRPGRALSCLPMPLDQPLGSWIQTTRHIHHEFYRTPQWVYARTQTDEGENAYRRYNQSSNLAETFYEDENVDTLPANAMPVKVHIRHKYAHPLHPYQLQPPPEPPVQHAPESENEEVIRSNTKKIGVSDGSVDPVTGRATFAWILTTRERAGFVRRSKPVLSNPKYMNSFRAELAGVTDLLTYLVEEMMHDHEVELWCDNKGVVDKLTSATPPSLTEMTAKEGDLLKVAGVHLSKLPHVTVNHVYGHQEDVKPLADLPLEAQLKVECDHATRVLLLPLVRGQFCTWGMI